MRTRTFSAILLVLLFHVFLIGGPVLAVLGFGSGLEKFQAQVLLDLQGVPGIAIGVVGVILFFAGIGVGVYIQMEYEELWGMFYGYRRQREKQGAPQITLQNIVWHPRLLSLLSLNVMK